MNIYKLTLKKKYDITQVPDSQKLFGALMHHFSDLVEKERCNQFVQEVKGGSIEFLLSNVMPKDCYPVPLEYIMNKKNYNKDDYKALKGYKYAKKDVINQLLQEKDNIKELVKKKMEEGKIYTYQEEYQQRLHIADDYGTKYLKNIPFSIQKIQLIPYINEFYFFIAFKGDGEIVREFEMMLHKMTEDRELLVLGSRASQGLNLFQLETIEKGNFNYKCQKNCKKVYLNMGMLLPNCINFKTSVLRLFTSERRPYKMNGLYEKEKLKGNYISFIDSGSIIETEEELNNISKCESSINEGEIIFGKSFLYPLKQENGVYVIE